MSTIPYMCVCVCICVHLCVAASFLNKKKKQFQLISIKLHCGNDLRQKKTNKLQTKTKKTKKITSKKLRK